MRNPEHIPSISDQGFTEHLIPNSKLSGDNNAGKFNGCIIEFCGKTLFAYRAKDPANSGRYNIALHEITPPWEGETDVGKGAFLKLPGIGDEGIFEDCRLFEFKGRLWMSYCEVIAPRNRDGEPIWSELQIPIHVVRLDKNYRVEHHLKIEYGLNFQPPKAVEKNWTFFEYNGKLHFCYGGRENKVVRVCHETGMVIEEWSDKPIDWPHGKFRGGTCPILDGDSYICFIHNSGDHKWLDRRYTLSAYRFQAKPPFSILAASNVPLIYGSEREPFCGEGNARCIFPMGAVKKDGTWYVSCGINDTCNYIVEIPEEKVEESLVGMDYFERGEGWTYWEGPAHKSVRTSWGAEIPWTLWKTSGKDGNKGVYKTGDPYAIAELESLPWVKRLTKDEYMERVGNTTPSSRAVYRDKSNSMSGRGGRSAAQ